MAMVYDYDNTSRNVTSQRTLTPEVPERHIQNPKLNRMCVSRVHKQIENLCKRIQSPADMAWDSYQGRSEFIGIVDATLKFKTNLHWRLKCSEEFFELP